MRKLLLLLLGLLLIFILSYLCFMGKTDNIKSDLLMKTEHAYADKSMDWVSSSLKGEALKATRILVLTGTTDTLLKKEEAEKVALGIEGVTSVENNIIVEDATSNITIPVMDNQTPLVKTYTLSTIKMEDGEVTLEGYVSNEEMHKKIITQAETLFGKEHIIDKLKEVENAPDAWEQSIELGLIKLGETDYGHFQMDDQNFTFEGHVGTEEKKDLLLKDLEGKLASNFLSRYNIEVSELEVPKVKEPEVVNAEPKEVKKEPEVVKAEPKEVKVAETPKVKKVPASTIKAQAKTCQKNFRTYLSKEKINFSTNKAYIKKSSHHLLNELIKIAKSCPKNKIVIEGHTDSDGLRKYNKKLSERRANAVKSYLIKHGIKANRLKSVGYGEMKPIAKNSTKAGKRQNRRIEFNVKGVK